MKISCLLTLIVLTGCSGSMRVAPDQAVKILSELRYIKDPTTGLCFASIDSITYGGWRVLTISHVPCESIPAHRLVQP